MFRGLWRGVAVVGLVSLIGCQQPDLMTMKALNDAWGTIEPYAVAGVAAAEDLDELERENRLALIEEFGQTIEEGLLHARE